MTKFNVFTRRWYADRKGEVPLAGPKHYLARGVEGEDAARQACREWNAAHVDTLKRETYLARGGRKAEFEEA